ncbi:hypothetical protein BDA96_08G071900 [Sorghum bicolor]|uniref:Uncharacterized protein n=1 Tax=Sorghum bicolor TaxID=4558 RepID=A0A921QEX7_SORBI|nr:hypothetical protein BDA96_08G071900 [Sorghum bicolor]
MDKQAEATADGGSLTAYVLMEPAGDKTLIPEKFGDDVASAAGDDVAAASDGSLEFERFG